MKRKKEAEASKRKEKEETLKKKQNMFALSVRYQHDLKNFRSKSVSAMHAKTIQFHKTEKSEALSQLRLEMTKREKHLQKL